MLDDTDALSMAPIIKAPVQRKDLFALRIVLATVALGFMILDIWSQLAHHDDWELIARNNLPSVLIILGFGPNRFYPLSSLGSLIALSVLLWLELRDKSLSLKTFLGLPWDYWAQIVFAILIFFVLATLTVNKLSKGAYSKRLET